MFVCDYYDYFSSSNNETKPQIHQKHISYGGLIKIVSRNLRIKVICGRIVVRSFTNQIYGKMEIFDQK